MQTSLTRLYGITLLTVAANAKVWDFNCGFTPRTHDSSNTKQLTHALFHSEHKIQRDNDRQLRRLQLRARQQRQSDRALRRPSNRPPTRPHQSLTPRLQSRIHHFLQGRQPRHLRAAHSPKRREWHARSSAQGSQHRRPNPAPVLHDWGKPGHLYNGGRGTDGYVFILHGPPSRVCVHLERILHYYPLSQVLPESGSTGAESARMPDGRWALQYL